MPVELLELDEDDGISGYVVSPRFESLTSLDRQTLLDQIWLAHPHTLTRAERRQILMIAALTPCEYESIANDF